MYMVYSFSVMVLNLRGHSKLGLLAQSWPCPHRLYNKNLRYCSNSTFIVSLYLHNLQQERNLAYAYNISYTVSVDKVATAGVISTRAEQNRDFQRCAARCLESLSLSVRIIDVVYGVISKLSRRTKPIASIYLGFVC